VDTIVHPYREHITLLAHLEKRKHFPGERYGDHQKLIAARLAQATAHGEL
jgi:hypothetical protein